jgi:hypothetical protein
LTTWRGSGCWYASLAIDDESNIGDRTAHARKLLGWRLMPTTDNACPGDQGRGGEPFWNQLGRSASIASIDCTLEKLCEARH